MRDIKIAFVVILSYPIALGVACKFLLNPKRVYRHITMERKVRGRHGKKYQE